MIWVAKNLYFFNCLLDGAHTIYCTATVFCPISSSLFFTPQIKYFKLILLIITIYRKAENSHEKQAGHEPPDFVKRTSSYFPRLGKMYTGTVLRPWYPAILHHPFCAERTGIFLYEQPEIYLESRTVLFHSSYDQFSLQSGTF